MRESTGTGTGQQIRTAVVLAVGVIAAIQSYNHIENLALAHMPPGGASVLDARLLPLSVDGLIISASLALSRTPRLAQWLLALGVTATVAANVAYGLPEGIVAALVSAWPGVSFVGSAELLLKAYHAPAPAGPAPVAAEIPVPAEVPEHEPVPVAIPAGVPVPEEIASVVPEAIPAVPIPIPGGRTLAEEFRAEIAQRKIPGVKQIQRRMGGGQPLAYQYQERLRALATTEVTAA